MNKKLTYAEWVEKNGSKIKGNPWMSVEEQKADFEKFHGKSLQDEVDKINQQEYQLYLQRVDAWDT